MKRASISKKLRFEILRRDGSACRYCGRRAPDIVLEVDHLIPVALGGTNELLNLVAACEDCNSGKSARSLDDATLQREQENVISDLNGSVARQAEILRNYESAKRANASQIRKLIDIWWDLTGENLGEAWFCVFQKWVQAFGFEAVHDAINSAARSARIANVGRFAAVNYFEDQEPGIKRCYLNRGFVCKRFPEADRRETLELLIGAKRQGAALDQLAAAARKAESLDHFRTLVGYAIRDWPLDEAL